MGRHSLVCCPMHSNADTAPCLCLPSELVSTRPPASCPCLPRGRQGVLYGEGKGAGREGDCSQMEVCLSLKKAPPTSSLAASCSSNAPRLQASALERSVCDGAMRGRGRGLVLWPWALLLLASSFLH